MTSTTETADAPVALPEAAPTPSREEILAQLKTEQNFARAIPAGLAAATVGAVLWAAVVFATNSEIGLIAVAVGAVVGLAVKKAGRGVEPKFGILGGACAAFGWALGTVLCDIAFLAQAQQVGVTEVLGLLTVDKLAKLVSMTFQPMDLAFLAIAVYEGYKFSFRVRLEA
jgi:hypothetical protein